MADLLKLNLGSGKRPQPGYINVDKFGTPDVLHDLETLPWPWETSSVGEVLMDSVLEHLGETTQGYFAIVRELYRICAPEARIEIVAPHPRHDDFIGDPTHVRVVTPQSLKVFSKAENHEVIRQGFANSPLALYLDVDFELVSTGYILDEPWARDLKNKQITENDVDQAIRSLNNVVKEIRMVLKVIKPAQAPTPGVGQPP